MILLGQPLKPCAYILGTMNASQVGCSPGYTWIYKAARIKLAEFKFARQRLRTVVILTYRDIVCSMQKEEKPTQEAQHLSVNIGGRIDDF